LTGDFAESYASGEAPDQASAVISVGTTHGGVKDCTFWYTQEYLGVDVVVIGTWRTRIVSFKFPGCKK
jgi:hypothetical protein